jgi:hypothetical protein
VASELQSMAGGSPMAHSHVHRKSSPVVTKKRNATSGSNWLVAVVAVVGLVCGLKVSPLAASIIAGSSELQVHRVKAGSIRTQRKGGQGGVWSNPNAPKHVPAPPSAPKWAQFGQRIVAVCPFGQVHTLLLNCCYSFATLFLHYGYTDVTLSSHCCYTVGQIRAPEVTHAAFRELVVDTLGADTHSCYTVVTQLLHCRYTVVTLL